MKLQPKAVTRIRALAAMKAWGILGATPQITAPAKTFLMPDMKMKLRVVQVAFILWALECALFFF